MKEESIDFKAITAHVVTELGNMPIERIRERLLEKVWMSCMEVLNKAGADAEPLLAEKALSELLKKDVVREKVVYKKDSFRLRLENGRYRVYKNGPHGATFACPWPAEKRYEVNISGQRLAEFIIQFDKEIPAMASFIPKIMETIRERELKESRRQMEAELKEQVLTSLIEQFVKPLGLSVQYNIGEDDVVSMNLTQILTTHLEVPLSRLQEILKDSDSLIGMMNVVPQKESHTGDNDFIMIRNYGLTPEAIHPMLSL